MAVDDFDVIDFVSTPHDGSEVLLSISDHLPWDRDNEHLATLQQKLNLHLDFIQTGQLAKQYPQYAGLPIRIDVYCKYKPSRDGERLLGLCRDACQAAGWDLTWTVPSANGKTNKPVPKPGKNGSRPTKSKGKRRS